VEILETKSSAAYWQALYLRRLWAWGIRPGDRILRMLQTISPSSISFFIGGSPLARLFRKEVRLLDMRPGTNTRLLKEIMESRINVLLAQPSTLLAIIKIMEENGLSLSLKTVITTGENLTPAMRKRIQDTFHCEVYDQYSTVELGNIAWECPTHTAYHINADSVVLELKNPRRVGRSTVEGEALGTCLYRHATPVIRYLTGDVVRQRNDECPCGRGLPLLESVEGRLVDFIVAKDGSFISPYVLATVLQNIVGIKQFKIVQRRDYSIEVQTIAADKADLEKVALAIESTLTPLTRGLQIKVLFTDSIEVKGAKFRLVESQVPK
jgi:phenylacetate-CoA ligase